MTTPTTAQTHRLLLIGAGPGLGAAIAQRFAREGFAVTLVARREQILAELAAQLRLAGAEVDIVTADIADLDAYRAKLEDLALRDVIVYNAALLASDDLLTSDTDYLLSAYRVNVLGAAVAAQVFAPVMRTTGVGTLLFTGGGLGTAPHPQFATMSLGKAALRALVDLLSQELTGDGVHVAGVTITGNIASDSAFDPVRIAETYWELYSQPADQWQPETVFDGN